jgi:hypothetical protein
LASRGFLVVYPNVECPFFPEEDTVTDGVVTYLHAIKKAVRQGLADPDQIIFGGYSMGARIAALATAVTTGLDPLHLWPDPIACVYEAMAEFNVEPGLPVHIPGPRPSDWAPYIAPEIPQTVICAEEDIFAPTYDRETGDWDNGAYFYTKLRSNFAQLLILKSGSTVWDRATHGTFMVPSAEFADALDLWGHMKIVVGMANYHFLGGSRHWAYGLMRRAGGFDHAGHPMLHELHERHGGQDDPEDPQPDDPNDEITESAR